MGKVGMELDFIEMHAIKHALQNVVRQKKGALEALRTLADAEHFEETQVPEINRLEKDIAKETSLIKKFETEIEEYREKNRIPRKTRE